MSNTNGSAAAAAASVVGGGSFGGFAPAGGGGGAIDISRAANEHCSSSKAKVSFLGSIAGGLRKEKKEQNHSTADGKVKYLN